MKHTTNIKRTALLPSIEDKDRHPRDPKRAPGQCRQWLALSSTQRQSEPEALCAHLVFGALIERGSQGDPYGFADVALLVAPGVTLAEALGAARRLVAELETSGERLVAEFERRALPDVAPLRHDWEWARCSMDRGEEMFSRVHAARDAGHKGM